MPTIRANDTWIRFEQKGEPGWPTVVLVHGEKSSADAQWLDTGWVERLSAAKRRSVRFDLRGHGRSERRRGTVNDSLDVFLGDLEEILRYANARSVDLFGWGLGAEIGLELVKRKPGRVRSLVVGGLAANAGELAKLPVPSFVIPETGAAASQPPFDAVLEFLDGVERSR
ncbi:MAG TPA: alpha/beta hydrolase [Myxococcota bacterium]|nr:alpha/beta hydrolase [Myxococcota bacterium]